MLAKNNGITLIELIIVIIIIGIISVMVLPKWTVTSVGLEFEASRLLNDIRYVQALSVTSGQRYRWVEVSSTAYQILNESGVAVILPSGSTQVNFTSGVSLGALVNLPNNLLAFDSKGIPYIDSSYPGTALASTAQIPLTAGGATRTVQILAQTGYGALQ